MNYHIMDEEAITIAEIADIKSIYLSDLMDPKSYEPKTIANIGVMYGKGKMLSYCETDKHFSFFCRKLKNQYHLEKEKNEIYIDQELKDIFKKNYQFFCHPFFQKLKFENSSSQPLLFRQKEELTKVQDIIINELTQIANLKNVSIHYQNIYGLYNRYYLVGSTEHQNQIQPLTYKQNSHNQYSITIGNFLFPNSCLKMTISLKEKIKIDWQWDNFMINGYHEIINNHETVEIFANNHCIYFDVHDLVSPISEDKYNKIKPLLDFYQLPLSPNDLIKLPWNMYSLKKEENDETSNNIIRQKDIGYITILEDQTFIDLFHQENVTSKTKGWSIPTNCWSISSKLLKSLIETTCHPVQFANSEYQENFAGQSFYHQIFNTNNKYQIENVALTSETQGYQLRKKDVKKNV